MGSVSEHPTRARTIEERAHEREPIFDAVKRSLIAEQSTLSVPGFGTAHDLVIRLLRRAPEAWLHESSPENLAKMVSKGFEALHSWHNTFSSASPGHVLVFGERLSPQGGSPGTSSAPVDGVDTIRIALLDRPFIINTIDAVLRAHGRRPLAFLHPILAVGAESVSLSLIQLHSDSVSAAADDLEPLLSDLRRSLAQLTIAADDFSDMRATVEHCARILHVRAGEDGNASEQHEAAEFLSWLGSDSLVIEGVALWPIVTGSTAQGASLGKIARGLGLFRPHAASSTGDFAPAMSDQSKSDAEALLRAHKPGGEILSVTPLSERSLFHHRGRLISIHVLIPGKPSSSNLSLATSHLPDAESPDALRAGLDHSPFILSIVGQLTSKANAEEGSRIPVVRARLRAVLEAEGLRPSSHLYKSALRIVDTTPKHFVLSSDQEALHIQVSLLLEAQQRGERACVVRRDRAGRGLWAVVALPSFELTPEIRTAVLGAFAGQLEVPPHTPDVFITNLDEPLCRIYLYSPSRSRHASSQDALHTLETLLLEESKGWTSALRGILLREASKGGSGKTAKHHGAEGATHHGEPSSNGARPRPIDFQAKHFSTAFPDDYQAIHCPEEALQDVALCQTLSQSRPLAVKLSTRAPGDGAKECFITVCRLGGEITLSRSLPILEHAGFEVLHERAWRIRPLGGHDMFLHRFPVRMRSIHGQELPFPESLERQAVVAHGIEQVLSGRCEDDILNSLMATAGLSVSSLSLLRAYCMLLWQVRKFATRQTIREAFSNNPEFALKFWEVAKLKFDPSLSKKLDERKALVEQEMAALRGALHQITDITADRILRALVSLLNLTVRTNFFVPRPANGLPSVATTGGDASRTQPPGPQPEVVALKIHSEQLELLTHPRPLFEIFVSAPAFEGVHLRGSRVARGGIRWSDRREDFRTEVRDLMRTQQVKNAIIVPSGAKGGFVVKDLPIGREAQSAVVRQCYQEFIRALLSITDNRVQDSVVPPLGVVCHDEPDPYLVVAADKGTASFSDVANAIAVEEFNFWLGDAFASGGSNGYDHKRLGVTARGAWEAVRQHFKVAKIDFERAPFTVVGIGDMSGDVFGNGLLESKNIKLIGAFNHRHIFIDPNPDPTSSWKERSRLFNLPFSQWSDYDSASISAGGMIAERTAKEIRLSPEARSALGVPQDTPEVLSGEQIISLILKAPVDLLWNGGIGTYVKSRSESDGDVDDSANDPVRVCADEVRAKVIAEGGNLGLTQRARIEYAGRGGLINTDAIDNSGGVDTSDHEVNLKILFSGEVKTGRLALEERNQILRELSSEVVSSVLSHNRGQAILLASSAERGSKNLEYFKSLMSDLTRRGYLNRAVHILPSDETLEERARKGMGLFRPELAMCTAGVKLWMKDELLNSGVTSDPALAPFLMDYFPAAVRERFPEAIRRHPLAANIIATRVANDLIETVGLTFVHRMCLSHSVEPAAVLRALAAAHTLLNTANRKSVIQRFDTFEHHERFLQLRIELSAALREATAWLISQDLTTSETLAEAQGSPSIQALTQTYAQGLRRLFDEPLGLLSGKLRGYVEERLPQYEGLELTPPSALNFAVSPLTPTLFEIVSVSQQVKGSGAKSTDPLATAALTFSTLVDTLGIYEILAAQRKIRTTNKWEHELLLSSYDDIRRATSALSVALIQHGATSVQDVTRMFSEMPGAERLRVAAQDFKEGTPQVARVSVFARLLRTFALGS